MICRRPASAHVIAHRVVSALDRRLPVSSPTAMVSAWAGPQAGQECSASVGSQKDRNPRTAAWHRGPRYHGDGGARGEVPGRVAPVLTRASGNPDRIIREAQAGRPWWRAVVAGRIESPAVDTVDGPRPPNEPCAPRPGTADRSVVPPGVGQSPGSGLRGQAVETIQPSAGCCSPAGSRHRASLTSRSPRTSMYGTFCSWASRILFCIRLSRRRPRPAGPRTEDAGELRGGRDVPVRVGTTTAWTGAARAGTPRRSARRIPKRSGGRRPPGGWRRPDGVAVLVVYVGQTARTSRGRPGWS